MNISILLFQLFAWVGLSSGFTSIATTNRHVAAFTSIRSNVGFASGSRMGQPLFMSSQWEDDEEEEDDNQSATIAQKSFDDAGDTLRSEEDSERLNEMGDYDANPAYKDEKIERVRQALIARTAELGIEKSANAAQAIKDAEARARAAVANRGAADNFGLDLSQISTKGPSTEQDDRPTMFFEPETQMTEEEMAEADPVGLLSIPEQVATEWNAASWPTFMATLKEVLLLIFIVAFTGGLIISWDSFLRETYTNIGILPKKEEMMTGSENLALPEGWLDGMSEDDVMNFQDERASSSSSSSKSSSPSVNALLDSSSL